MKILIDTREQQPFTFTGYDVDPEPATLPVGDYSLPGFEDRAAVERKSLGDLIGCLMGKDRERFERELARGRHYDLFMVVVELSLADVSQGRYRSDMKPQAALQSIITFQVRYRVPFVWAGNRKGAEYITYGLLSKYLREIEERYKRATKAQDTSDKRRAANE
jgi:DNA excision repair protein ERCC-4